MRQGCFKYVPCVGDLEEITVTNPWDPASCSDHEDAIPCSQEKWERAMCMPDKDTEQEIGAYCCCCAGIVIVEGREGRGRWSPGNGGCHDGDPA